MDKPSVSSLIFVKESYRFYEISEESFAGWQRRLRKWRINRLGRTTASGKVQVRISRESKNRNRHKIFPGRHNIIRDVDRSAVPSAKVKGRREVRILQMALPHAPEGHAPEACRQAGSGNCRTEHGQTLICGTSFAPAGMALHQIA